MILTLKILAIIILGIILYEDNKNRQVYWFLFPILGLVLFLLFLQVAPIAVISLNILFNLILVTSIISILYVYSSMISKKKFLDHSFGTGDLLFFYAFCLGFPSVTFIVLFSFSILFSALIYFILKKKVKFQTVPLAGYMSLFLIFVYSYSLFFVNPILYIN